MPEQISKYPEVTLKVLKGAGGTCGEGAPQKILTQCPAERFCSLPSGEICVYGIGEIAQMTQLTPAELARTVCPGSGAWPEFSGRTGLVLLAVFLAGVVLGKRWARSRAGGFPASG